MASPRAAAWCWASGPNVRFGTVGEPTLGVAARISPQGELQIRGSVVFQGCYKNEVATREAIVDGWLHTGDVAAQDDDGQLRIVDWLKDIVIELLCRGLRVQPAPRMAAVRRIKT